MKSWDAILLVIIVVVMAYGMPEAVSNPPPNGYQPGSVLEERYEHPHDAAIRSQVKETLLKEPRIHWNLLDVQVVNGKVDLYGQVRTEREKALATSLAAAVPGVKAVGNHLLVKQGLPEEWNHGKEPAGGVYGPTPF